MISKMGYYLIIIGILVLIGYGIYNIILDFSIPVTIKIGLSLVIVGVVGIIGSQIFQRRKEEKEKNDSGKY